MADGPEADVDDPPSIHFPPLITVSDLPSATAAGNHESTVCSDDSSVLSSMYPAGVRGEPTQIQTGFNKHRQYYRCDV